MYHFLIFFFNRLTNNLKFFFIQINLLLTTLNHLTVGADRRIHTAVRMKQKWPSSVGRTFWWEEEYVRRNHTSSHETLTKVKHEGEHSREKKRVAENISAGKGCHPNDSERYTLSSQKLSVARTPPPASPSSWWILHVNPSPPPLSVLP